jgi:hypothetical protein
MPCEAPETETVSVVYFVDAEFSDVTGAQAFGPVGNSATADQLLIQLAGRSNCIKATKRKVVL